MDDDSVFMGYDATSLRSLQDEGTVRSLAMPETNGLATQNGIRRILIHGHEGTGMVEGLR